MGRLVIYDNVVQDKLNTIIKNKTIQTGLIIGQCTEQKDIVVRLCLTPPKDEESASSAEESPKISKNKSNNDLEAFDEQWLSQHAKQLLRALPGGMDILGLYVAGPTDFNAKQQAQLRQILFSVYKLISKNKKTDLASNERILLNICTTTFKISCRTFDIADFKCSSTPAEWKLQAGPLKWQRVRCQLAVDLKFPIPVEDASLTIQRQIDSGLRPFFARIEGALALIDGLQREEAEPLSVDSRKSKKKSFSEKDEKVLADWHDVEFFILSESAEISEPVVFDSICMMTFKGAVHCRAYVHAKATVAEAIHALKKDIMRSIASRVEIHCEDLLLIDEEQQDPLVVHELPRRVFAPLPQADICVCDYQFHNDSASDSLDAFKELLNLDLEENDIDTSCEKSPTTSTLILPEVMEDRLSEFGDAPPQSSMNLFVPVLAIAATVFVGMASYFMQATVEDVK